MVEPSWPKCRAVRNRAAHGGNARSTWRFLAHAPPRQEQLDAGGQKGTGHYDSQGCQCSFFYESRLQAQWCNAAGSKQCGRAESSRASAVRAQFVFWAGFGTGAPAACGSLPSCCECCHRQDKHSCCREYELMPSASIPSACCPCSWLNLT